MRREDKRRERILELYGNNSMKPIYKDDISNETLEITAEIYSRVVFNLDHITNVMFYQNMFETFPLETILKTLARILLETKPDKNTPDYKTAKGVFIKMTKMLNLTNRDVVVSTTAAQELSLYHDEISQDIVHSKNKKTIQIDVRILQTFKTIFCRFGEYGRIYQSPSSFKGGVHYKIRVEVVIQNRDLNIENFIFVFC